MNREIIQKKWREFNFLFWIFLLGLIAFIVSENEYLFIFAIGGICIPFILMKYSYDFTGKQTSQILALIFGFVFLPIGYLLVWNYRNKALKSITQ